jgi:tetratricopeptide (TPR) repeat protein
VLPPPSSEGATVYSPDDWHRVGREHLVSGRLEEAVHALRQAEQRGVADAASELGLAYRRLGHLDKAEEAWLRVLHNTSNPSLRRSAASDLVLLYEAIGSPAARRVMRHYIADLETGAYVPKVPHSRIRQTKNGVYVVARAGTLGRLQLWWLGLSRVRRRLLLLASSAATLLALVERLLALSDHFPP